MFAHEPRVLIVDDSPMKIEELTGMVEGVQGQVVGSITEFQAAVDVILDPQFPRNVGDPNVVLLDGNMTRGSSNGSDGNRLFITGRRTGRLHEVSSLAPGVLAVSCSALKDSEVSFSTGATVGFDAPSDWKQIIDGHLSDPQYIPQGTMRRELIDEMPPERAFDIAMMKSTLQQVIKVNQRTESARSPNEAFASELDPSELHEIRSVRELQIAMSGLMELSAEHFRRKKLAKQTVETIVRTDTGLVIFAHNQRPNPYAGYGSSMLRSSSFDIISADHFADVPSIYWREKAINPAILTG